MAAVAHVTTPAGVSEFGVCDLHIDDAGRHGLCLDVFEPNDSRRELVVDPVDVELGRLARRADRDGIGPLIQRVRTIEKHVDAIRASPLSVQSSAAANAISVLCVDVAYLTMEVSAALKNIATALEARR